MKKLRIKRIEKDNRQKKKIFLLKNLITYT
jgi:hypothetical protein